jgi:hypothetical protein
MTEAQWLACDDPEAMLEFLRGDENAGPRRLLACALGRLVWERLEPAIRQAIERAEERPTESPYLAVLSPPSLVLPPLFSGTTGIILTTTHYGMNPAIVASLVRDVFGNPFRPSTCDPAWRTPDAVALAQAAYDQRHLPAGTLDAARLAVLADALEDAGCDSTDILNHLRQPGIHVRGCWAVDAILGKE